MLQCLPDAVNFQACLTFALGLEEITVNMSNLSHAVGEVCDMGCNYTFPEKIAEFARTHPDSEAFVFRQMEGNLRLLLMYIYSYSM